MRGLFRRFVARCRSLMSHWFVPESTSHVGRISAGEPSSVEPGEEQEARKHEERQEDQ